MRLKARSEIKNKRWVNSGGAWGSGWNLMDEVTYMPGVIRRLWLLHLHELQLWPPRPCPHPRRPPILRHATVIEAWAQPTIRRWDVLKAEYRCTAQVPTDSLLHTSCNVADRPRILSSELTAWKQRCESERLGSRQCLSAFMATELYVVHSEK